MSAVEVRKTTFEIGQQFTVEQEVTEELIETFARVSKDQNPLHLNPDYARQTRFRERIAHGMLGAGLISAAVAAMGGEIGEEATMVYIEQSLRFLRPAKIGDTLTAVAEILEVGPENFVRASTLCRNQLNKTIMEGEALLMADPYPYHS